MEWIKFLNEWRNSLIVVQLLFCLAYVTCSLNENHWTIFSTLRHVCVFIVRLNNKSCGCWFEITILRKIKIDHFSFLDWFILVRDNSWKSGNGQIWITLTGTIRYYMFDPTELKTLLVRHGGKKKLMRSNRNYIPDSKVRKYFENNSNI